MPKTALVEIVFCLFFSVWNTRQKRVFSCPIKAVLALCRASYSSTLGDLIKI